MNLNDLSLVVIQATPFCNLDCSYCYLPNRSNRSVISTETCLGIFQWLSGAEILPAVIDIVWHAGEPLVLKPKFYADLLVLANDILGGRSTIRFGFQTNGTLVDPEWCEFLALTGSNISFSIDGPKWYHDLRRFSRSRAGSFDAAISGLRLAQTFDLNPTIISVISKQILDFPQEFFEFCLSAGAKRIGLNVEEIEGINTVTSLESVTSAASFIDFFSCLTKLSASSDISFREIDTAVAAIEHRGHVVNSEVDAKAILSFAIDGSIGIYSPELITDGRFRARHKLGSIHDSTVKDFYATNSVRELIAEVEAGVNLCRQQCAYFSFCGGGSPSNKFAEYGRFDTTKTLHCGFKKRLLLNGVLSGLEGLRGLPIN